MKRPSTLFSRYVLFYALLYTLISATALVLITQVVWTGWRAPYSPNHYTARILRDGFSTKGISKCNQINNAKTSPAPYNSSRDVNPHYDGVRGAVVIIQNAMLWDPEDGIHDKGTLIVVDGVIRQVIHNEKDSETIINLIKSKHRNIQIVNAAGRFVTPGLIDMHSHAAAASLPDLKSSRDNNEASNPVFPAVRIMDSIKPDDLSLPLILSGGVTTSMILPGSSNVIGGEGAVIKMRQVKEHQWNQYGDI
ncbi:hypothetical protein GQ42DRAFT_159119 [Ramicandelaber brevisporus]|nr:hypothetical protein GQ42DRAFT_159119 [Ramicandelaber brevisporus]